MNTCEGITTTAMANCLGPVTSPAITSVTLGSGMAKVSWMATPGATYTLQYKTNLYDPSWISIPGNVTASGDTAEKSDVVGSTVQRLYRIMVLP
jgi:hypothetical protein